MNRIPVCWDPRQVGPVSELYRAYADVPRLAVEAFAASGLPVEVKGGWEPASAEDLELAHDARFVRRVLEGSETNGFGNENPAVAEAARWECGSMLAAAREAIDSGGAAMSPSRGFHHATYDAAWNFCTFNGLVVAARRLKAEGRTRRVGILDFDCHWGNGTDDLIERLGLDWIVHWSFGRFKREVRRGIGWDAWLEGLEDELEGRFASCDLMLYQAGADPHIEDRFGGELTADQMRLRDRAVFRWARSRGVPVAWNLAGGYQEPAAKVAALHLATMEECAEQLRAVLDPRAVP